MKKLYMTMLTVLACGAAYALPVGNPSEASLLCDGLIWEGHCGDPCDPCLNWCDAFSVRVGFYGDYVFNRHMEVDGRGDPDIEHTEIYTNAGYIAVNFWDRFDVFTTLGATNLCIDTNVSAFRLGDGPRIELETDTDFSWSIGVRGTIWECGCTSLGAEAQYFRARPDISRITGSAQLSEYPNVDAKYHEWQVGLGISHRINMLVPYLAVKYSRSEFDMTHVTFQGQNFPKLQSQQHWGYAVGVSLVDCEKASLTVEGRFGDEKAVYVNAQVRL
ncbi:MAG: Major outer membrane porin [Chlamydiales bacterium]|nr:Major outer membrane porin [Chlamydiales bacterium]